jgi:hypothetical protein
MGGIVTEVGAEIERLGRHSSRRGGVADPCLMPQSLPRVAQIAVFAVPVLLVGACGPTPVRANRAWHGSTPISATYQFGRLTADLPPGTRVETAIIAAQRTLERQGHTVESVDVTPSEGKVVALAPATLGYDKVTVRAGFEGQGTVLRTDVWPPSENRSRALLESFLQVMGL